MKSAMRLVFQKRTSVAAVAAALSAALTKPELRREQRQHSSTACSRSAAPTSGRQLDGSSGMRTLIMHYTGGTP
jgi:hypothetical protein